MVLLAIVAAELVEMVDITAPEVIYQNSEEIIIKYFDILLINETEYLVSKKVTFQKYTRFTEVSIFDQIE